jgi:hypothetical protein
MSPVLMPGNQPRIAPQTEKASEGRVIGNKTKRVAVYLSRSYQEAP